MKNNGITLIALIITILILIIIAGVSISFLTGENGILTKALDAMNKSEETSATEEKNLELYNQLMESCLNNTVENVNERKPDEYNINFKKEYNYLYTGNYQIFTAEDYGYFNIECWGASGKNSGYVAKPGLGSYTSGSIYLNKGEKLFVYIGEVGNINSANYGTNTYNGGGYTHSTSSYYGRGGGATDIRLVEGVWNDFNSLASRIMIAAGGGSGHNYVEAYGGPGGGLYSYKIAGTATTGKAGTQNSGYGFGLGGPRFTKSSIFCFRFRILWRSFINW